MARHKVEMMILLHNIGICRYRNKRRKENQNSRACGCGMWHVVETMDRLENIETCSCLGS